VDHWITAAPLEVAPELAAGHTPPLGTPKLHAELPCLERRH
jgi:hypothetical protein